MVNNEGVIEIWNIDGTEVADAWKVESGRVSWKWNQRWVSTCLSKYDNRVKARSFIQCPGLA